MGGLALFAIMKMLWIMLAGVQAANFFFLFIILLGSFAGVFLGMDIRDPVRSGSARSPPHTLQQHNGTVLRAPGRRACWILAVYLACRTQGPVGSSGRF